MRKRMYFIPAGVILFILFFTVFGERGLLRIYHLSKDKQEMEKRVTELKAENDRLRREIEALQSDRRYLESIARRDFGLVRPNEVIYQFPSQEKADPSKATPPPTNSAPVAMPPSATTKR
ncbi:FtsB family cell division protein [Geomobilimonas luticola]|uniref:Septum formation initiator family protein n=1 Tax=Geomobilimonas luticola TaxID=1114878 RepID=A0ABS5SGA2_9BACT|nr:septum formation initiator family protein [Geomobilimonas luticola]MBT0654394.1 septum formation initiator family protein [Geomobilimonas luticola]